MAPLKQEIKSNTQPRSKKSTILSSKCVVISLA